MEKKMSNKAVQLAFLFALGMILAKLSTVSSYL